MYKTIISIILFIFSISVLHSEESKKVVGYRGIIETGYELGFKEYNSRFKANIINGYQFNNFLSLGLGIGVKAFNDMDMYKYPVYIDFRTKFVDREASPFFGFAAGLLFEETRNNFGENEIVSGYIFHTQLGVIIKTSTNTSINLSLGVDFPFERVIEYNYIEPGNFKKEKKLKSNINAICFNISFSY